MADVNQVVIDTNVLVAALRSKRGASHKLLLLAESGRFETNLSVPLVLEYEEVLQRSLVGTGFTVQDIDDVLNYLCSIANRHDIHYLWRPFLKDADDDFVLELAVSAQCDCIVTHNIRDFEGAEKFGVKPITPAKFLNVIGEIT